VLEREEEYIVFKSPYILDSITKVNCTRSLGYYGTM